MLPKFAPKNAGSIVPIVVPDVEVICACGKPYGNCGLLANSFHFQPAASALNSLRRVPEKIWFHSAVWA